MTARPASVSIKAMRTPLWISVFGWSGSGKTTLVARLVSEFSARGLSCACAKRARHAPAIAPEGKDSTLFLQAGARASAYVGESGAALFLPPSEIQDRAYYAALLPPADITLLEGAEVEGALGVLVSGEEADIAKLKRPPEEMDLVVSRNAHLIAECARRGLDCLRADDIAGIADRLLAGAPGGAEPRAAATST